MIGVDPRRFEVGEFFWREMIRSSAIQCIQHSRNAPILERMNWLAGIAHPFEPPAEGLKHHEVLTGKSKHRGL